MTNLTIRRHQRFHHFISVFDFQNFLYAKYFFHFREHRLTFLSREFQTDYGSRRKWIFLFFFHQLLENDNFISRCNVPGLKMTCQWKDKYVIYRMVGPYKINLH